MATFKIIQECSDVSDIVPLFPAQGLYLKPIAKLNISVHLPTLKLPGKTISNHEVIEKLKYWTIPDEFTSIKVSKNTLEFIRFEAEIESRSKLSAVLARLDGRSIKISGFTESLKVRAAEAKCDFPTRHVWDSYFRDSKNMNEMKPGERPDTIHISNLPCEWFASRTSPSKPNEFILKKVFETFGEVRFVDIPMIDPYRTRMKGHISGIKMFSYHQNAVFEGYIQFKDYVSFMKAMDALRGMKLLHKEDRKTFSASIVVDFDKTKHLSDSSIKKRRVERDKMMTEEREREEHDRMKKEKEEAEKEAERLRKLKEKEEKLARRKQREEKRKMKQLQKLKVNDAEDMNRKIASEERLLLMAQRRLESIRLLTELIKRVEESTVKRLEEKRKLEKLLKKAHIKKGSKAIEIELKLIDINKEDTLKKKLIEKLKKENEDADKFRAQKTLETSDANALSLSEGPSLITSSESDISEKNVQKDIENEPHYKNYSLKRGGEHSWYPPNQHASAGFIPYQMRGKQFGRPYRPYFPRGRRGFRWPRFPGRGRGGYMNPYYDPLLIDINQQYYKYFHKLTHNRSRSISRSDSYSRYHSRSRTRSRSHSRRYTSRSRSRSHCRSSSHSRSRSRRHSRSRSRDSRRHSDRSSSRWSKSNYSKRSRSRSYSKSRSRSNSYNSKRQRSGKSKSLERSKVHHQLRDLDEKTEKTQNLDSTNSENKTSVRKSRWDDVNTSDKLKLDVVNKVLVKDNQLEKNSDRSKNDYRRNKSPVRFPSLSRSWSRSPSLSLSLSLEDKDTKTSIGEGTNVTRNKDKTDKHHKKDKKKHKRKKKHKEKKSDKETK